MLFATSNAELPFATSRKEPSGNVIFIFKIVLS
jgi:hypothetical protein